LRLQTLPAFWVSIDSLEWRYGFALIFIERFGYDASIFDFNVWRRGIALPRQRVHHPVFVVALLASQVC
jgi:hypothetical protein